MRELGVRTDISRGKRGCERASERRGSYRLERDCMQLCGCEEGREIGCVYVFVGETRGGGVGERRKGRALTGCGERCWWKRER